MNRFRRFGRNADQVDEQDVQEESDSLDTGMEPLAERDSMEPEEGMVVTQGGPAPEGEPLAPEQGPIASQNGASVGSEVASPVVGDEQQAPIPIPQTPTLEVAAEAQAGEGEMSVGAEVDAAPEEAPRIQAGVAPEEVPLAVAAAAVDGVNGGDTEAPAAANDEPQTAPLPPTEESRSPADSEELSPLPANAVVAGKYVVQSQLHYGTDRNLYRITARRQQKCDVCGRLSTVDVETCEYCGTALSSQAPAEFYLMAESFKPEALMHDPALMDLRLYHPNLVPVVDFLDYTPFGRTRYYAIAEPRQGVRLSQMSMPRPPLQVFGWALQLADALDYLHSRGVVGAGAEADDILVQGDMASLASLQNARTAPEDEGERVQMQSMDLAKLAATVYEAYTGHPAAMSPEGVLPMPPQAPPQVGPAFQTAIEPVQGNAAPISAAQWRDALSAALLAVAELEQPGRPVEFRSASKTNVGRLRDQNQDSMCTSEFLQSSVERPMRLGLYVVADGMGGHKGGEIASAIAAQAFSAEIIARAMAPLAAVTGNRPALSNEAILQAMSRAVQSANERVYKARDNRQNDMGTTLVAALVSWGKAYIINVGDSRIYLYTRREVPAASPGVGGMSVSGGRLGVGNEEQTPIP